MTQVRAYRTGLVTAAPATTQVRAYRAGVTSSAPTTKVRAYRAALTSAAAAAAATKIRAYRTGLKSTGINQGPFVSAGSDQTVESGAPFSLVGADSDADGQVVSRAWSIAGTVLATTAIANVVAPVVTADTTLTYTYSAVDDQGVASVISTQVTVRKALIVLKRSDGSLLGLVARRRAGTSPATSPAASGYGASYGTSYGN